MAFDPNKPSELVSGGFDPTQPSALVEEEVVGFDPTQPSTVVDDEGPGAADYAAAFAADIAISEAGRLGGAAAGTAVLPGIGTAVGYVLGGMGAGASGSIARQRILDPDGDLSYGQIVADAFINLIPGAKGAKFGASAVARQAAAGAGISAGARVAETAIDEGELPSIDELTSAGLTGAALGAGLGVSGEAFSKAYSKFAGMPTRRLSEAFKIGDPDAKLLVDGAERTGKEYAEMLPKNFNDIKMGISDAYSDEMIRARVLQDVVAGGQIKQKDAPLKVKSDDNDFYLQRRLSSQKITEKAEEAMKLVELDGSFLITKAKEIGTEPEILSRSVNQYLYAKHGIAYNKANKSKYGADGAGGETTKDFKNIIKTFESQGLNNQLKESIGLRQDLSKKILNTLQDGGLIAKADADKLRKKFPDYVPLNRIMEADDLSDVVSSVSGRAGRYETTASGMKRAVGSDLEVDDIYKNIFDNLVNATQRAEVNKANQAFVRLIRDNPSTSKGIAEITKPKVVGNKLVKDTSDTANALRAEGKSVPSKKVPIYKDADRNVLTVFEDGKPLHIKLSDPRLAAALKGNNKQQVEGLLRMGLNVNRLLGGLYTRQNPEFLIPNLFRDRSEAFVNSMSNMKFGQAVKLLNPVSAMNDDIRTIRRNLLGNKAEPGTRQAELDVVYEEFVKAGGRTGGVGLSTVADINESIKKLSGKLNQPAKSKAKVFNDWINRVNEYFENASRFSVYRNGRASGMTQDQAAFAARNSSFDPNLQGSQGDTLRALYLFSNPAIQGAKNFLRSMNPKKNPKTFASVMTALGGISYTVDRWNSLTDENWRDEVGDYKTNKHITIVTGKNPDETLKYISIPIGYSMVPYKVVADYGQRIIFGEEEDIDVSKVSEDMRKSIIGAYNPMGGSPVPTVFRPILELSRNKNGIGQDIRPEWLESKNVSAVEKIHPWTADTQGGELAMNLSEQLQDMGYEVSPGNLIYLYQTYTGGPGKFVQRLFDVTSKMWNKEKLNASDVPLARRFFGQTYSNKFEERTGEKQIIENIQKQENTSSAKAARIAFKYKSKIQKSNSPQERSRVLQDMLIDPDANESVTRRIETFLKDEAAGITAIDKQVKGTLSSTGKAQFFIERIEGMNRQEAARYLQEQINRGVLTPKIEETMGSMQAFKSFFGK